MNQSELWDAYFKSKDPAIKEKLILEYAPLVKFVAGRVSMHFGQHVEYDDLISYGIFGLIDAIDKFDKSKNVKFETYASLRIRGSIIDNIRKLDWIPRSLRHKNKQLEQSYQELESQLGREPTDNEFAEKMDMTVQELRDNIKKSNLASLISLDEYIEQNNESGKNVVSGEATTMPELQYERKEIKQMLIDSIEKLSDKEKKVITLYYFEDLTLKEISRILGVSESRISQIHAKAVLKLKTKLGKYKSILFGL